MSALLPKILIALLIWLALWAGTPGATPENATVPSTGYPDVTMLAGTPTYSSLPAFVQAVQNGDRQQVVGIYAPGALAYPVGQQPKNSHGYVTRRPGWTTQYGIAGEYGTVGILAHNDLAGKAFYDMAIDQLVIVVFGDGRLEYYAVSDVQQYQALTPNSTHSEFINLDGSQEQLTANQLFTRIYTQRDRLVLQTCLEASGLSSWGRTFFIAQKVAMPAEDGPRSTPAWLPPAWTGWGAPLASGWLSARPAP